MVAARAMWHGQLPDGGLKWLHMKPQMRSIGRCALHRIAPVAWPSKLLSICLHFCLIDFVVDHTISIRPCCSCNELEPSYHIVLIVVINLIVCYGCPLSTMDTVSATIFECGGAIH